MHPHTSSFRLIPCIPVLCPLFCVCSKSADAKVGPAKSKYRESKPVTADVVDGRLVHIGTRPGVHSVVIANIRFEVAEKYLLQKIVGKGSYGAVAYVHVKIADHDGDDNRAV